MPDCDYRRQPRLASARSRITRGGAPYHSASAARESRPKTAGVTVAEVPADHLVAARSGRAPAGFAASQVCTANAPRASRTSGSRRPARLPPSSYAGSGRLDRSAAMACGAPIALNDTGPNASVSWHGPVISRTRITTSHKATRAMIATRKRTIGRGPLEDRREIGGPREVPASASARTPSPPGCERAESAVWRRRSGGGIGRGEQLASAVRSTAYLTRPASLRRVRAAKFIRQSCAANAVISALSQPSAKRRRLSAAASASRQSGCLAIARSTSETDDVARALPDRVERHLAIERAASVLLDVAVAAEALPSLRAARRRPRLQIQYFAGGRRDPRATASTASACASNAPARRIASAVAASDSSARSASTLRISGWSIRLPAERARDGARGGSPATRTARMSPARAEHAIEAAIRSHLEDDRHAAPFVADEPRAGCVAELDLARVALDRSPSLSFSRWMRIALHLAVRREARQEEAGQSAGRLGEDQERVAHRRGEEPLVPDDRDTRARLTASRLRRVRAQIGAALLLGHSHPERHAALFARRG